MEANHVNTHTLAEPGHQSDAHSANQRLLTYIRPLKIEEGTGFAVCSEHGTVLAAFPTYDAAYYTSRQFHLTPSPLH